jgi:hypothetical protein
MNRFPPGMRFRVHIGPTLNSRFTVLVCLGKKIISAREKGKWTAAFFLKENIGLFLVDPPSHVLHDRIAVRGFVLHCKRQFAIGQYE